jgi:DNA primase
MEDLSRSTNFDQFVRDLTNSEKVKTYIQSRNLDDIHIANKDLGFCSPYSKYMFPLLRGRLIVPIRDVHGRLIALAGRQVPDFIEVTKTSFWDTVKSEPAKADDRINK